jgi:hypothetical protein
MFKRWFKWLKQWTPVDEGASITITLRPGKHHIQYAYVKGRDPIVYVDGVRHV